MGRRKKTDNPVEMEDIRIGCSCWCPLKSCFANNGNEKCTVLRNTNFGEKDCPFYKTREQYSTDLIKADKVNAQHAKAYRQEMLMQIDSGKKSGKRKKDHESDNSSADV